MRKFRGKMRKFGKKLKKIWQKMRKFRERKTRKFRIILSCNWLAHNHGLTYVLK